MVPILAVAPATEHLPSANAGRGALAPVVGDGKVQNCINALEHPTRSLWFGGPDRPHNLENLFGLHVGDGTMTDDFSRARSNENGRWRF